MREITEFILKALSSLLRVSQVYPSTEELGTWGACIVGLRQVNDHWILGPLGADVKVWGLYCFGASILLRGT